MPATEGRREALDVTVAHAPGHRRHARLPAEQQFGRNAHALLGELVVEAARSELRERALQLAPRAAKRTRQRRQGQRQVVVPSDRDQRELV